MDKLSKLLRLRRFYYTVAIIAVIAANINALAEPTYATVEHIWSRQQSVIAQYGRWDTLEYEMPVNATHAALLNTGKVLIIAGSGNDEKQFEAKTFKTVIWDPVKNTFKEVPTPWDAFCAGHVFLPDGRLLVAGGTGGYEDLLAVPKINYEGLRDSYIFDPKTERYEKVDDMEYARWYPTLVMLANGKVLAAAGLDDKGNMSQGQTEIFDPATGQWTTSPNLKHVFPTYPSLTLMADGRLFYSGSAQGYVPNARSMEPGLWNLKTNNFQVVPGLADPDKVNNSMTVLLPPAQDQRVMVMGGAGNGDSPLVTNRTAIVDLDATANPSYVRGPNLQNATRYPGVVILPNDKVFESGGSKGYRNENIFSAEIFDPKTNTFSKAATPRVGRNYHAEAILLPDGRVATFGSNPIDNTWELRIEVYSPAYLFKGSRPAITGGETKLTPGTSSTLQVNNPWNIKTAKLIRPMAVTHVTDVEQRSIDLPFKSTKDGISVDIPDNRNLVPPGWYMAFVTDKNDIPSSAYWVHVQ
jgi:hypothetical protein